MFDTQAAAARSNSPGPLARLTSSAGFAPVVYLGLIWVAEAATAMANPNLGLALHAVLLVAILVHGSRIASGPRQDLIWGLAIGPLIRILSLSLPIVQLPFMYWYAIISVPVFAAAATMARVFGYTPPEVGLPSLPRPRDLALWLRRERSFPAPSYPVRDLLLLPFMIPMGLFLGIGEYLILQPQPLAASLRVEDVWLPMLILTVSTGLEEEFIFRGVLQRAASRTFGAAAGLLYVSGLFAVLHTGYLSWIDLLFVFAVGHLFALISWRTKGILAVTAAHACVNISMFVLSPHILPLLFPPGA